MSKKEIESLINETLSEKEHTEGFIDKGEL